jgi:hypothetical protein
LSTWVRNLRSGTANAANPMTNIVKPNQINRRARVRAAAISRRKKVALLHYGCR